VEKSLLLIYSKFLNQTIKDSLKMWINSVSSFCGGGSPLILHMLTDRLYHQAFFIGSLEIFQFLLSVLRLNNFGGLINYFPEQKDK